MRLGLDAFFLIALLAIMASGCAAAPTAAPPVPTAPAVTSIPIASPVSTAPAPTSAPTAPLSASRVPPPASTAQPSSIDYRRSGGFAGLSDHLVIQANGHATLARRNSAVEFDVSRDDLNRIYAAFAQADFATIPENSNFPGSAADAFEYVIVYQGHRVQTADNTMPEKLMPVIKLLNSLIDTRR